MAKKTTPIITHTEILNRAIRSVESEIDAWRNHCHGLPKDEADNLFVAATKDLVVKLTALKSLYLIETGSEWEV